MVSRFFHDDEGCGCLCCGDELTAAIGEHVVSDCCVGNRIGLIMTFLSC
jgi:hypothetical protein